MKIVSKLSMLLAFAMVLAGAQLFTMTAAHAQSSYFTSRGCADCHSTPVVASCNGCHYHGNRGLKAVTSKTSYAPGETVSVTLTSTSTRSGWIGANLYNQNNALVASSNGTASGMGGSTTFPATLAAPAPTTPGTYTWRMAYYGNQDGTGTRDVHTEAAVSTNSFTVAAPVDATLPTVSAFTLPATATSLTVPVSSLSASDNVAVTGYLVNTSATKPLASAAGWSATAPTSVTAPAAGSVTFYAWAKDAAGNVSDSRSATVVITLPDTTLPTVGAFTLPATTTSLTVPVSSLTASDNIAVTGYLVNTSATKPLASAAGWSATAPTSVTAPAAGSVTFYAWAKDAAGNVSASRSATVVITLPPALDTINPTLSVSTLSDGAVTNNPTLNVSGKATDDVALKAVTVNGSNVQTDASGHFSTAVVLVAGNNTITIVATDDSGNKTTAVRTVTYSKDIAVLSVAAPADNMVSAQQILVVQGTVGNLSTVTVTVNNDTPQVASLSGNTFSASIYLQPGINTISIQSADSSGNITSAKRTVFYYGNTPTLAITEPQEDSIVTNQNLVISGKLADNPGNLSVQLQVDGNSYTPPVVGGTFQQSITLSGPKLYTIVATATDDAGNQISVSRNLIFGVTPPTGATLSANASSPIVAGTQLSFAAAGQGGAGDYEYKFFLKNSAGAWSTLRNYSATSTLTWNTTGLPAGTYRVVVHVRNSGSTAPYEAFAYRDYSIAAQVAPVTGATLSATHASPLLAGTQVNFTGTAQGGTGTYEYKFFLKNSAGVWSTLRNYSATSTLTWNTTGLPAGTYRVVVHARSSGSVATYEAFAYRDYILQ